MRSIMALLLVYVTLGSDVAGAQRAVTLVTYLEQQLGLDDQQARGALDVMLVFAKERLTQSDFELLVTRVPNVQRVILRVRLEGIVTHPLTDVDDYESTLANLGIAQPLASHIPAAVLEYLGDAGLYTERDILASILE
jgi:hypothetical protein